MLRLVVVVLSAALALLIFSGPARADFGIAPGSFTATVQDDAGNDLTQAGAHPNGTTSFELNTTTNPVGGEVPDQTLKDVQVDLPAGLIGNPQATPQCAPADFNNNTCAPATQVGTVTLDLAAFAGGAHFTLTDPVYNLKPAADQVAQFGFFIEGNSFPVLVSAAPRTDGDFGLSAVIKDLPQGLLVYGTSLTFWGVPANHNASGATPEPFFTNPTLCGPPLTTQIRVDSYQNPGQWVTAQSTTTSGPTGCDRLTFDPSISVTPDSTVAGQPAGYAVDLRIPQNQNPNGLATPELKAAAVKLPPGVVVSPSAADGLAGCSDAQIALGSNANPACPAASVIGTVSIATPLLASPLQGQIYLGSQTPSQLLRLFLVVRGQGLLIKLSGTVVPDPVSGQLTATFANNPQLPFSDFQLNFKSGPRAPLVNSRVCGTTTTTTNLAPYSDGPGGTPDASPQDQLTIDQGCGLDQRFSPSFSAGTTNASGGKDTTFTLTFSRSDADQALGSLAVNLPPGLLGRIGSVPPCPEGAASAGACSAVSQVGSATTGAGPGSNPFYLPGKVYITGPYKGAPFGLSIIVPALAGPFNLGTVVVRAAIFVDPMTAAIRVVSDPLPTILQGIPLQIRTVNVTLDRPGFMLNPTNCVPAKVTGTISSAQGATSNVSSPFQVGDCAGLAYTPKLSVTVGSKGHTARYAHLPLTALLTQSAGQANNRTVQLDLPGTINSRIAALQQQCVMASFLAGSCSAASKVGTASAITPLLRDPLIGSVYFVKNSKKGALPILMIDLRGDGVRLNVRGDVSTPHERLRTRITSPDAPVTRFRLTLTAGKNAPLSVTVPSLCQAKNKNAAASIGFRAQSNKLVQVKERLHVLGCTKATSKSK